MIKFCFGVGIGILLLGISPAIQAAGINLSTQSQKVSVRQQFEVGVFLNPQKDDINAVEGSITFPAAMLQVEKILDGGSAASLWVIKPAVSVSGDVATISFSGVSPGRIDGYLFSVLFTAKQPGDAVIAVSPNGSVLLNNGKGTKLPLAVQSLSINIGSQPLAESAEVVSIIDTNAPLIFTPYITRDKNIFGNKWFLVFHTQDKESGVAEYRVLETPNPQEPENQSGWVSSESPYILTDQSLSRHVYVEAIDNAGNKRVVSAVFPTIQPLKFYQKLWFWGIMLIVLVLAAIITRKIHGFK